LSMVLARQVLHRAVVTAEHQSEDAGRQEGTYSRREVHQATGMILAQMRVTPADALLVLRGHAFASGRTVLEVAADVIDRRLDFSDAD
jgi:AmiR/NasT family two-component response regulator